MIVVRTVMQGKFGYGGVLAGRLGEVLDSDAIQKTLGGVRWRLLTCLSGSFDKVEIEVEVEDLAAWDALRSVVFSIPEFIEAMTDTQDITLSGSQEFLVIEAGDTKY